MSAGVGSAPTAAAVIGAGGWGTALAILLAGKGVTVRLWARRREQAKELAQARENRAYLPGVPLPETIECTADLAAAVAGAPDVILAVPSQAVREVTRALAAHLKPDQALLNTAKGLERTSLRRLSEVIAAELGPSAGDRLAVLSGPSHAEEAARGIPTTAVVASASPSCAERFQALLMGPSFRLYTNSDLVGVELGGSLKNIIALAAGISDGLGFGDNTKAALVTRGLAEISRLGLQLGAQAATFAGLAGMGDLIATCTSPHSRNARAGREIGRGRPWREVVAASPMVVEGIPTTEAAVQLAKSCGVEMPIAEKVHAVLFAGEEPLRAVAALMSRDAKDELAAILS